MSVYLDASVLLPTLVPEPASAIVDRYLEEVDTTVLVSEFAAAEVASALSRLVRSGEIEREQAIRLLSGFDGWRASVTQPVDLDTSDMRLTSLFVRQFDLMIKAPDALHVAVCSRLAATLVTLDRRLAAAAQVLDVPVELVAVSP